MLFCVRIMSGWQTAALEDTMKYLKLNITDDKDTALLQEVAQPRTFKSGKTGFGVYGKMVDMNSGDRYQMSINIVKIDKK